mmetsp:Transcript_41529/g.109342  ORF Transcript_41529/g.109342 Transcript_41529/m.109342 type:complete len:205 (+) Transcript_41529:332-946(+)
MCGKRPSGFFVGEKPHQCNALLRVRHPSHSNRPIQLGRHPSWNIAVVSPRGRRRLVHWCHRQRIVQRLQRQQEILTKSPIHCAGACTRMRSIWGNHPGHQRGAGTRGKPARYPRRALLFGRPMLPRLFAHASCSPLLQRSFDQRSSCRALTSVSSIQHRVASVGPPPGVTLQPQQQIHSLHLSAPGSDYQSCLPVFVPAVQDCL